MAKRLSGAELIELVENITNPRKRGFTSEEINQQLLLFCIHSPDPAGAMDLMVESMEPMTSDELVDRALALPFRDPATLSESELAATHPLRYMTLDE
jgi:hypothetical protein